MAALTPTALVDTEALMEMAGTTMNPRTRDELLLKTIARVERIDTEVEVLIDTIGTIEKNTKEAGFIRRNQIELAQDIKMLKHNMNTVKRLLADILTRLPNSDES